MNLAEILNIPDQEMPFIEAFNRHEVRYLVIGGTAVRFHGCRRLVNDLDIVVDNSKENARRVCDAVTEVIGRQPFTLNDLCKPGQKLSPHYYYLDILTSLDSIRFDEAYDEKVTVDVSGITIHIISKLHLICSKKASSRGKDLDDVQALERS
jgi:predicted nucleotidyltransferase component of viral defense system